MLSIQINDPELEKSIKQTYGNDLDSLTSAFAEFIQQQKIKRDIDISIKQLDAGEGIPLAQTIGEIRAKYE